MWSVTWAMTWHDMIHGWGLAFSLVSHYSSISQKQEVVFVFWKWEIDAPRNEQPLSLCNPRGDFLWNVCSTNPCLVPNEEQHWKRTCMYLRVEILDEKAQNMDIQTGPFDSFCLKNIGFPFGCQAFWLNTDWLYCFVNISVFFFLYSSFFYYLSFPMEECLCCWEIGKFITMASLTWVGKAKMTFVTQPPISQHNCETYCYLPIIL